MYINSQLSTCVGTQSPKYIEMAQGHISLSKFPTGMKITVIEVCITGIWVWLVLGGLDSMMDE
jgi:hypothetical protein